MFDVKTKQTLFVVIALVVVIVLFYASDLINLTYKDGIVLDFDSYSERLAPEENRDPLLDGGVMVRDEVLGQGEGVSLGSTVVINYVGYLEDGTVFDDFFEEQATVEFEVGAGKVIDGMEAGVLGMKVGGKRSILIKPEFAYNGHEFGEIPANSSVIFDVVLVAVQS